jgi:nucleoside phosphorylase
MPQWQVNDLNVCESQELIHGWKEGSAVYWHLHLTTNGINATDRYVRFEVEYGYSDVMGVWVFPATLTTADLLIPANTPSKTMMIMSLGSFTPPIKIGGHVVARLRRIAAVGAAPTANPWIPMLQLHIQLDTLGSRTIGAK